MLLREFYLFWVCALAVVFGGCHFLSYKDKDKEFIYVSPKQKKESYSEQEEKAIF